MHRDVIVKGRSLGGTSDLTLLAPLKPGFAASLESVTYKTRTKRVLDALHTSRAAAHEYQLARFLSDAVERVGVIHSVRVAVLEPEDKVLLAVTFDGSWSSYIRVLWEKVGTLLDLIFCGTVDYVTARDHGFDAWVAWAHRVQVETGFFYGPPEVTAMDIVYHRRLERMRQRWALRTLPPDTVAEHPEVAEACAVAPGAEDAVVQPYGDQASDDMPLPPKDDLVQTRMGAESIRSGLQGLAGLYRLADLFPPGTADGDVLRHASLNLLKEFVVDWSQIDTWSETLARKRFDRQLRWLLPDGDVDAPTRRRPVREPLPEAERSDIQAGIVHGYEDITHGLVLMLGCDTPAAVQGLLGWLDGRISRDDTDHRAQPIDAGGTVFRNLAFTAAGLQAAGMADEALELFPEEFRQGMDARAGTLGDLRLNHPRRWKLPPRFVDLTQAGDASAPIELAAVHAVLQLRCRGGAVHDEVDAYHDARHPLRGEVQQLLDAAIPGLHLLAVQSLRRHYAQVAGARRIVEHFGYADGEGQPVVVGKAPDTHVGEVLLGYNNAADTVTDAPAAETEAEAEAERRAAQRLGWLRNGSFLVMRKYHQDVPLMRARVDEAAARLVADRVHGTVPRPQDVAALDAAREDVYAKMMGRYRTGEPLADIYPGGGRNDFGYDGDPRGERCPLHAHIRRAHPRRDGEPGERPPRLMRRSMAYGPPASDTSTNDRGLLFMAFNASLSEQFEVVQRWLAGGNSTGSSSGQSCPIVGVPDAGHARQFRFVHDDGGVRKPLNMALDVLPRLYEEPRTVTRLEWGMYLFAPSLSMVRRLAGVAACAVARGQAAAAVPWQASRGRTLLADLRDVQARQGDAAAALAWKAAIEDPEAVDRFDAASLWAAIREDHGGILRTPYGVLVADRDLLLQVYHDNDRYSVRGQRERMVATIGDVYLGKDAGPDYTRESSVINPAILAMAEGRQRERIYAIAFEGAARKIREIGDDARTRADDVGKTRYEVGFEAREVVEDVLADLGEYWFGIGPPLFCRGGQDWQWEPGTPPPYPGHLTALSRYMFQPNPGDMARDLAARYGKALRAQMLLFVRQVRATGVPRNADGVPAPITQAAFDTPGAGDVLVADTLVGVLMGLTPTIMGTVYNVLREWQRDGTFARLRAACQHAAPLSLAHADALLGGAIRRAAAMRPMPQLGWRTVVQPHRLGPPGGHAIDLRPGDKLVLANVSGTQQSLEDGCPDGRLMFGGERAAPGSGQASPTHACPGYGTATATLLGTLAALLQAPGLRPGQGQLAFELRGDSGYGDGHGSGSGSGSGRHAAFAGAPQRLCPVDIPPSKSRKGVVLAWGDSWLGYYPFASELRDWLEEFGYLVPDRYCKPLKWLYLLRMPDHAARFREEMVDKYLQQDIKAILLSGGGNDSVGETLMGLLNRAGSGLPVIDRVALKKHLDKLEAAYLAIIDEVRRAPDGTVRDIRVVLHGYDHPIPVEKGNVDWIRRPFWERGYVDPADPQNRRRIDVPTATAGMRELIDALNETQQRVAGLRSNVHHVDARGTVAAMWPGDPQQGWNDNLHPEDEGFRCIAARVAEVIERPAAPAAEGH